MKPNLPVINAILIGISLAIIIVGFVLMIGEPSTSTYNPDIFSVRRITVGPMISLFGFVCMIAAILYKRHNKQ
jgi:hypothetical protein